MSTVYSTPPPPPPTVTNTQNVSTAVVVKSTAALNAMTQGQSLQATVTAKAAGNQIQVQTPSGPITLQVGLSIPKGSVLTMVLSSLTPPIFQIGLVDGKPVGGALTQAQAKTAGLSPQQTSGGALPQPLQVGTKLNAVLVRPATLASTTSQTQTGNASAVKTVSTAPALIQGQTPQSQTPSVTSGGARTPISTPSATQPSPASALNAAQGSSLGAALAGKSGQNLSPSVLPSGTRFSVTIVRVENPGPAANTPPTLAPKSIVQGQTVTGTVIGRTPQGQPIVQTSNATISLNTQSTLANGSKVTLQFNSAPSLPEPSTAAQRLDRAALGMGLVNAKSWDGFGETLKTLAAIDPGRFQSVIQNALPQPGAKLNNQMLFFLSALKGGDLKGLFGDAAHRILTKERPALMTRLGGDFQTMAAMADDPQSGDWRLSLIPMWNGERLDQIRFYHRGKGGSEGENEEENGTRFVLDIELSNLGRLQIDGLMSASKTRLDLILRTETPLPEDMRLDIGKIAEAAQELLGLSTAVTFQAKPEDFVEFPPNALPEQGLIA